MSRSWAGAKGSNLFAMAHSFLLADAGFVSVGLDFLVRGPQGSASFLSTLMETTFFAALEFFLLLNIALGLVRLLRGPTSADRMLAIQLFGTTGVGLLLVMAHRLEMPPLRNVALVFALLATLTIVAYSRLHPAREADDPLAQRQ